MQQNSHQHDKYKKTEFRSCKGADTTREFRCYGSPQGVSPAPDRILARRTVQLGDWAKNVQNLRQLFYTRADVRLASTQGRCQPRGRQRFKPEDKEMKPKEDGSVKISNLVKTYTDDRGRPTFTAVKNINLEIKDGEFMVLVGPSGCGKSTTLRMVAGLEKISSGTIAIGGKVVNDLEPKDRGISMVFQSYALYPHMNLFNNMAFGLKLAKKPKKFISDIVGRTSKALGLDHMLERKPGALSGGQRQRVALGRAIVRNPTVFLFDEPLSNLDAKMRVQMRSEISRLHAELGSTMIYVTHDQVEAMTMGDRICVMRDGNIMQVADPLTLFRQPENLFVAGFIGSPPMNLLQGEDPEARWGTSLCGECGCQSAHFALAGECGGIRGQAGGQGSGLWNSA